MRRQNLPPANIIQGPIVGENCKCNMQSQYTKPVVTGAIVAGISVLYDGQPLGTETVKKAGVAAGAEYVNNAYLYNLIQPYLPQNQGDLNRKLIKPLITGLEYALVTKYVPDIDNGSMLGKILRVGAASAAASYLPVAQ